MRRMTGMNGVALFAAALALTLSVVGGCTLAPEYRRPAPAMPSAWNAGQDVAPGAGQVAQVAAEAPDATAPAGASGASAHSGAQPGAPTGAQPAMQTPDWRQVVVDAPMARLVDVALSSNRDLRVAVLQIEKARAQHAIARADLFPHIDASGAGNAGRTAQSLSPKGEGYVSHAYTVGVGFSAYELDLFGRVRSLKEQALERFLSTDAAARSVQLTLVAEVGQAYLTLVADREQLALAREILETEQASFEVVQSRYGHGIAGELDVARARTTVDTARVNVAAAEAKVTADENALALLLGTPVTPDMVPACRLADVMPLADVPPGVPSEVLSRRPDVVAAEHTLKAANANIGAARAQFFPRIGLTASYGNASNDMENLFRAGAHTWSFVPQVTLPIFHAGAIRAGVETAEADRDIYVAQYEKAVQTAFREVSDTLAQGRSLAVQTGAQTSLVEATATSYSLASKRYESGIAGYLDKLDAQRSYAVARQNLIAMHLARQNNRLTLFKALGGGWGGEPMPPLAPSVLETAGGQVSSDASAVASAGGSPSK